MAKKQKVIIIGAGPAGKNLTVNEFNRIFNNKKVIEERRRELKE